ncbi:TetR/AcrR family transcriptional regulator [Paraburkholderia caballeronis]|uniref:DNA-binding transcriptional regulator, AcrR family n=1 Tax=Paraburkholderia caballeronis TaxID=416943 RepID=A0A1H7NSH1_9BURK|nr:TetR/AcrR family transcriptional regulator [Paraburkholderia caballeronis]PXW25550.1 TetR family transcriptional regulator [Paraburkholderia caballeronis]PXX01157.1 TetR family transcriptional regulator [Paraburkholderia caballeronis]RAJ99490.1 TetR family transcriptional regulator [Paraburkholderia caballeronis]SEE32727.1 transcriptional regulator, TetR family [Paraburkholderia caballeronis]SEL26520.1 DNA-binding transcriptional regulator, AcrR family [Paraburkholderia caballeronis]
MTAPALEDPPLADLPAPKRERGRQRVAAIMDAAVEVFSEKGYDAATMTEIAARSSTAIGSLYRFFPSKEALADALLQRYAQHVSASLAELEAQVQRMSMEALAGALVDFMLALQSQRRFAVALVDARGGSDERRRRFRASARGGIARILQRAIDGLAPAKAHAMSVVLLHLLKGIAVAADETPAIQAVLTGEIRELVRLYLLAARREARG